MNKVPMYDANIDVYSKVMIIKTKFNIDMVGNYDTKAGNIVGDNGRILQMFSKVSLRSVT